MYLRPRDYPSTLIANTISHYAFITYSSEIKMETEKKCLFLLSRPYQKLEFVARRRNKAGERSAIKATFKG